MPYAAATAELARAKTAKTLSPSPRLLITVPPWAAMPVVSRASWRASAACIASESRSQRAVLPSMSVRRNVTVPLGSSAMRTPAASLQRGYYTPISSRVTIH
jgi:hypothetical protein